MAILSILEALGTVMSLMGSLWRLMHYVVWLVFLVLVARLLAQGLTDEELLDIRQGASRAGAALWQASSRSFRDAWRGTAAPEICALMEQWFSFVSFRNPLQSEKDPGTETETGTGTSASSSSTSSVSSTSSSSSFYSGWGSVLWHWFPAAR